MKFIIKSQHTNKVMFEADLDATWEKESYVVQLGEVVKLATRARADLIGADLIGADLVGADLVGADLVGADLVGADLVGADLVGADLTGACLAHADLTGADLTGACLAHANLRGADLRGTDLTGACLAHANLRGADLRGADLRDAKWQDGLRIAHTPIQISGLAWPVTIFDTHMQIGCELHSLNEWRNFDDRCIAKMDGKDALKFWWAHKELLLGMATVRGASLLNKGD